MKRSEMIFGLLRIPIDALATVLALLFAYNLRTSNIDLIPNVQLLEPASTLPGAETYLAAFVLPSTGLVLLLAAFCGLYAIRSVRGAWPEFGRVLLVALLWLVGVMAWYFLVRRELFYSRIMLAHSTIFLVLFLSLGRIAVLLIQRSLLRRGFGTYHVVSMGSETIARSAREALENDVRFRYHGHLTKLSELQATVQTFRPDMVLQTDPSPKSAATIKLIDYCRSQHIGYAFLPPVLADVPHQLRVDYLGLMPVVRFRPTPLDGWGNIAKRCFDFVASVILLIFLSPLLLLIAVAVIMTMGRPVFYISRRVGERGEKFIPIIKFRSMVRNADGFKSRLLKLNERSDGPLFKIKNDPRITPLGRFLRRFDLDELPQLFNVLLGHMSLVGPRPHLPDEVSRYRPYERRVFAVRPGITGLAQVSGRSDLRFHDEVHLDLQYIEEWSIWLDIWILWRTVWVVLGRGE